MTEMEMQTHKLNQQVIRGSRYYEITLFILAAGLIGGFLYIGAKDTAEQLALILFGAFMRSIGSSPPASITTGK